MNAFFKNHSKMSGAASLKISNDFNYVCTSTKYKHDISNSLDREPTRGQENFKLS